MPPWGELAGKEPIDRAGLIRLEKQFVPLLISSLLPILLLPMTATPGRLGMGVLALLVAILILQCFRTLPKLRSGVRVQARLVLFRTLGLLGLIGIWTPVANGSWPHPAMRLVVLWVLAIFFLMASIRLVALLARVPRVNVQVLAGAGAGYVLLGITGGVLATATEVLQPGTFSFSHPGGPQMLMDRLTYFSFITIGGLGYGDILPANALGERFAIVLSVASTLYMSLLMGLLLGRFLASGALDRHRD